jgi:hypothetical protein
VHDESGSDATEVASLLPTHRDDYPVLAEALGGAKPGHLWVQLLDVERYPEVIPPTVEDMVLGPLEVMLTLVKNAKPAGLKSFLRERLRDADLANVLSARLELLCAANMAVVRVPFAFGGKGEADLTWNLGTENKAWLEIHRGAFSVFDDLQRDLEVELAVKNATLTIHLEKWPLELRHRNVVHSRISGAIETSVASCSSARIELVELGEGVTGVVEPSPRGPIGLGRVVVAHAGLFPSEEYMNSLARRLERKVNVDKAGQARKGSWGPRTVLLVDISTARLAQWLGPDGLAAWLQGVQFEWDDLPFAGVAICFSHLHGLALGGLCIYRPGLDEAIRQSLQPTLDAIGLAAMADVTGAELTGWS